MCGFASTKELIMEETFKNPPNEYRMLQIIHHYYDKDLAKNYSKLGFGGVVANVSFNDYLESESAWTDFIKCLNDFRDQGLLFWIYDEKGYPSGKAGGLVLRDHPEFEALGVLFAQTEGTGTIHHKIPVKERITSPPISIVAVPILDDTYDLNKKVDLTDRFKQGDSEIVWDAPDGKWCIMSFHISRMYEGTHCVANYSDPLPYINIIDRDAVASFIHLTHDAYKQRCGDAIKDYVQAFFTDEPSLMTLYLKKDEGLLPPIPWSNSFREDFRSRMGYDIVPELPHLFVDCGEDSIYKRLQFWKVISELIEENFYGQIQDWCHANGTTSSGHALWEEHLSWQVGFEGDLYRDLRRMDIPGIDLLNSNPVQLARSTQIPIPKFISSVTHLAGKSLCMSETSSFIQSMNKQPCSFEQRIGTINWQYVLGLTTVTSYYGLKEFKDGELNTFNEHVGRLGFMLTGGKHIADIAVFYPIHSLWGEFIPTDDIAQSFRLSKKAKRINNEFGEVSYNLLANQLDFDYLDDQAVLESQIEDGSMKITGEAFNCMILPNAYVMPAGVYEKIEAFVNSGGSLIALGGLPDTGMTKDETKIIREISQRLEKSGKIAIVENVSDVVKFAGEFSDADLSLDIACRELLYVHRQKDGKDIYFVSNSLDESISREITFRCIGKTSIWHPTTGEINSINGREENGKTIIKLDLKPFEGVFIIFELRQKL
jgi:hypothetical protein